MKITACVLTKNSSKKLPRLLKSLNFVNEIVVVDDESTDNTIEIAKKFGAKIFIKKLTNFGAQRNFSIEKASNNWILTIDSDEEIPENLKKEIQNLKFDKDGYYAPRYTFFLGKPMRHSGWYPDFNIRVFDRRKMKYQESVVHEKINPTQNIGYLKNALDHYSYDSLNDYFTRLKRYSAMQVERSNVPKGQLNLLYMILKPIYRFLSMYILKKGFLDGWRGLALAVFSGYYDGRVHFLAEKKALAKYNWLFLIILILFIAISQSLLIVQFNYFALVLPIMIVGISMIFFNLNIALLVVFLSILAGQIARIQFSDGGGFILSDLVVPAFLASWLFYKSIKDQKFYKNPLNQSLIGILAVFLVTYILSMPSYFSVNSFFYLIRILTYFGLFWPFYDLIRSQKTFDYATKIFEYLMYGLVLLGLIQLKVFPSMLSLMDYGWDPHKNRMVSTFLDPNFLAAFLSIGFVYFLVKFYASSGKLKEKWPKLIPVILVGSGVALTVSRSGWLMLAIILTIFGLFKDKKLLLVMLLVAILALKFIPTFSNRIMEGFDLQGSAALRFASWADGFSLIQKHWLLGVGYNNLEAAKLESGLLTQDVLASHSASGIDSSLMVVWSTTGLLGLIFFAYFVIKNISIGFKTYLINKDPLTKHMGLAISAVLLGLLVHSIFVNSLFYPHIIVGLMFILAVFYNLVSKNEKAS